LNKEARLISSVMRVELDPNLGETAEVWEGDLSLIRIGTGYAAYLVSDDEVMLLLSHELTHVGARTGKLNDYIESVTRTVQETNHIEINADQKEELACDFIGAEVLKRFIASHPTSENGVDRFSRAFGYEPREQRLRRAWTDFCWSYNGEVGDQEHLSQDQTIRSLLVLDPDFTGLIHKDASTARLCRAE
jgi:hypothetical protein